MATQHELIEHGVLERFCKELLQAEGVPEADAELVANILVEADLGGVTSHGVTRMTTYLERLRAGGTRRVAQITHSRDWACGAVLDGGNSLGQVVAHKAMQLAVDKARTAGLALVTTSNTQHTGLNAWYVREAARQGLIGLMLSNGPPGMAPWGGRKPFFSTNPFSCAIPANEEEAVVIDMATSESSRGKILLAMRMAERIPEGWAVDAAGQATTDPVQALAGALLPFGRHKGYGLALFVEVMAGVLSGAGCGPEIEPHIGNPRSRSGSGKAFLAVDIRFFENPERFGARMDTMIRTLRASPPSEDGGRVLVPGDLEREMSARRRKEGIPLPLPVFEALREEGRRYGIDVR